MPMVNTHVYFPNDVYTQISLMAQQGSVPVAALIRQFVIEGLEKKKTKAKAKPQREKSPSMEFLGKLLTFKAREPKDAPHDVSVNHDRYLYDE